MIVISKNIVVVLPSVLSARIATVIQLISHLLIVAVVWEDSCIADSCTVSVSYKSIIMPPLRIRPPALLAQISP